MVVSALNESSSAEGVNSDQSSNAAKSSGAAYLFRRSNSGTWSQSAYMKATNTGESDWFGNSLAVLGDGSMVFVSAPYEKSSATGINGDQRNDDSWFTGAVYAY